MNIKNAEYLKTIEKLQISLSKKNDRQKSNKNTEITHTVSTKGPRAYISFRQTFILCILGTRPATERGQKV
jgi:hypothetical protein